MRLFSGLLCAVLAFNAAARVYSQAGALCAAAREHRVAAMRSDTGTASLASFPRARRRRPTVAKLSFAHGAVPNFMKSSPLVVIAASTAGAKSSADSAPPDHPPA